MVQRFTDEIEQLKETSANLRETLESQKFEYDAIFQKQKLETVIEHLHLQETLEKLREELDKNNG